MNVAKFGKRNDENTEWDVVYNIEGVFDQEDSFEFIGERSRTAGGNTRQDSISIKRNWTFRTRPLTYNEAYSFINYLVGEMFSVGDLWLDDFGFETSTLQAYIPPEDLNVKRVQFSKNGTWHSNGRELSLRIEEK